MSGWRDTAPLAPPFHRSPWGAKSLTVRESILSLSGGTAHLIAEHQIRAKSERRPAPLDRANQNPDRRLAGVRMHGPDRDTPEAAIERAKHLGQTAAAPDQAEHASGFQHTPRGVSPDAQTRWFRDMRRATALVRRRLVPYGIVERRIHQY